MATTPEFSLNEQNVFIQKLKLPVSSPFISIDMLRLDRVDEVISGNKWFKLKYNLKAARKEGFDTILTFGGAYSNHLIATAAAARRFGFRSIGVINGAHHEMNITPTLRDCIDEGMQLHFITRAEYRKKTEPEFVASLHDQFGSFYLVPEGGANEAGRRGAGEIAALIPDGYTHIAMAVGTGTCFAGLRNVLSTDIRMLGMAPMKEGKYLESHISSWLSPEQNKNWSINDHYEPGRFGTLNQATEQFMHSFEKEQQIPLDRVYTGKLMHSLWQLFDQTDLIKTLEGQHERMHILAIHTGGLQGNRSISNPGA